MSVLRAFGHWVPARVAGNEELAVLAGCEPDWISEVSGIAERRWTEPGDTTVDLAVRAAENCLRRAEFAIEDVRLIIVASGTSERRFPGSAAIVAARLNAGVTPALDLPLASAGSLFGLVLAGQLAPLYGPVLVIATEILSRIVQRAPIDKGTAILFGDGAGAALVLPEGEGMQLRESRIFSDGSFADDLKLEFDQPIEMKGMTVIIQASRKLPAAIRAVLADGDRAAADVKVFLMHQANQNLIDRVAKAMAVVPERFYSNIARYGNTSSASMLIAASEYFGERPLGSEGLTVFAGFGAGFHWGALVAGG